MSKYLVSFAFVCDGNIGGFGDQVFLLPSGLSETSTNQMREMIKTKGGYSQVSLLNIIKLEN